MSTVIAHHFSTLTQKDILSALSDIENYFKIAQRTSKAQRRIYSISIEALQNVLKYKSQIGFSSYSLSDHSNIYVIRTSNKIHNRQRKDLEEKVNEVNRLSDLGLKEMQQENLKANKYPSKNGAGLGLIHIARKSNEKLAFEFVDLTQEHCQFQLTITVRK